MMRFAPVAVLFLLLFTGADSMVVPMLVRHAAVDGKPMLFAYPNPVPPGRNGFGTIHIMWNAGDKTGGSVYVSQDGHPETLFASGSAEGRLAAAWILEGSRYEFRLYSAREPRVLLASTTVRRRGDPFLAVTATLAALVLIPLVRLLSRAWLLDVGLPAAVIGGLWIKLVYVSGLLRPGGSFSDHRAVLSATLSALLLVFVPVFMLTRPWRLITAVILNLALTTLVYADLLHFRYFRDVISLPDLASATNLREVGPSIRALLRPTDALLYVDLAVWVIAIPFYVRFCRGSTLASWPRLGFVLRCLIAALVLAAPTLWRYKTDWAGVLQPWSRPAFVAQSGVLSWHLYDATVAAFRWSSRLAVTHADREAVAGYLAARATAPGPSSLFGTARGRNLVLLQVESLNAFPVGLVVGGQSIMPNLSRLVSESLHFVNFYDQTSSGRTADGVFTSLQGLHPLGTGVVNMRYSSNQYRALATVLGEHGYHTMAAWGARPELWNIGRMFERFGFRRTYFADSYVHEEWIGAWVPDREFLVQSLPRIMLEQKPFMAFLVTSSSHHPYKVPARYRALHLGPLEGTSIGDYLHALHYFDEALGEFLRGLRARDLLDSSVLVLYGDHGAYFDDESSSRIVRMLGMDETSEYAWQQIFSRVPFIVRLPYGERAGARAATGGHLDIAPTLLSILGICDAPGVMLGHDLIRGESSLVVFRDGSFVDDRHFYITSFSSPAARREGRELCYQTGTGQPVSCEALKARREEALERLKVSDLIIEGDLISKLRAAGCRPAPP